MGRDHIGLTLKIKRRIVPRSLQTSRRLLLQRMPKRSVCAEVGVFGGDFSEHIIRIVKPKTLHLIDPWKYEADDKYERSWYGGVFGVGQSHMDSPFESVRRRFRREIAAGTSVLHRSTSEAASHAGRRVPRLDIH